MQKSQPQIITISDLIQWRTNNQIELSPKYQRNAVWNGRAKSYLIDTIIRGLPIPPIFMRQLLDVNTRVTFKEIIDGQQRVRAIMEFADDAFPIMKSHNSEFGGKLYSELDDETKEEFLAYKISTEVIREKDDSVIYDMFARLNTNNIVLNDQEIRNAKYWGEFKVLVYRLSAYYHDFFANHTLLNDKEFARMKDSELINSMVLLMSEGIIAENKTVVNKYYSLYDESFPDSIVIENKINRIMSLLERLYGYFTSNMGCFNNKNYFFTLYCVIVNQVFGIKGSSLPRNPAFQDDNIDSNFTALCGVLSDFISEFEKNNDNNDLGYSGDNVSNVTYKDFKALHRMRTTSKMERESRISFLNNAFINYHNA
jgi:hypothetical protein